MGQHAHLPQPGHRRQRVPPRGRNPRRRQSLADVCFDNFSDAEIAANADARPGRPANHPLHAAGQRARARRRQLRAPVPGRHPGVHRQQGRPDAGDAGVHDHLHDHRAGPDRLHGGRHGHPADDGRSGQPDPAVARRPTRPPQPGGTVTSDGRIIITGNNGVDNAVDISTSGFLLHTAGGTGKRQPALAGHPAGGGRKRRDRLPRLRLAGHSRPGPPHRRAGVARQHVDHLPLVRRLARQRSGQRQRNRRGHRPDQLRRRGQLHHRHQEHRLHRPPQRLQRLAAGVRARLFASSRAWRPTTASWPSRGRTAPPRAR